MANPYSATLKSAADDGTNTYLFIEITDGTRTMPMIQATVPSGTSATAIATYIQNIATNQPTVAATVQALINVPQPGL
jgi:hypothetical protein